METKPIKKLSYSVDEVAKTTSLSTSFIRKQIRQGKLKAQKLGTRVIILDKDLQEWLNRE